MRWPRPTSNVTSHSECIGHMTPLLSKPNQGMLQLILHLAGTRTAIKDCFYHVPLQVLRPVYRDDTGMAYVYLLNPCGGVVGGDHFDLSITLQAGAHAYVTTPSATKLYAAPQRPARQTIAFTLETNSVLAYMPEQTIPFADAAFKQHLHLRMAPGACAFVSDILAPGRVARGEYFQYRLYDSHLRVDSLAGEAILEEHVRLRPQHQRPHGLALYEGYAYMTSFYALGLDHDLATRLTELLQDQLGNNQHLLGSATALSQGGVAVRLLSHTHRHASQALYKVWDTVRQQVHGYPAAAFHM
jgi:urease accessory protein